MSIVQANEAVLLQLTALDQLVVGSGKHSLVEQLSVTENQPETRWLPCCSCAHGLDRYDLQDRLKACPSSRYLLYTALR